MLGFNNNINLCNRFATSIYVISRFTFHYVTKKTTCETNYTHTYFIKMMKLNSLTKTNKMTVMAKKAGDSGDDADDV